MSPKQLAFMMMLGCVIVNSGVLVAKSVELEDRFENIGAQFLREVTVRQQTHTPAPKVFFSAPP